jgi:eukaryotic-like serine/threonine-protein kinase
VIGQSISHYQIIEKLGEGGMGVVYKARDTHLDRLVAIKVLPPEKVADADRKRRFVLEAKSASALNHPNIITIYDIASDQGSDFIAMEYVPGKALNQLIARRRLSLDEALKYAIQIADALGAAHAAGIIHRDLKPENVMVSGAPEHSGPVKVLDFGLAKLIDRADGTEDTTIGPDEAQTTAEGAFVGTVFYMSPEQAEGKKVDQRSDIFSFGALLYEMVTGRKAFQGDSVLSTMSATLREEPRPASEIVEGLPRELERIIMRCLRKSPERRFQAMPDLKVALEELKEESDSGKLSTALAATKRYRRWPVWVTALLLAAIAVAALWSIRYLARPPEAALSAVPLTTYPGIENEPTFSPDGSQVAFSWNGHIYVKLIGTEGPPLRLTADPLPDFSPAWSPDGRFVAFLRGPFNGTSVVLLIPALGGPERKVTEVSGITDVVAFPYLTWSPDSTSLVVSDSQGDPSASNLLSLSVLSIETGEKRRLTSPSAGLLGDLGPAFSPDGHTLAFSRCIEPTICDLYLLPISDKLERLGEPSRLTFGNRGAAGAAWTSDGREIVFGNWSGSQAFATWGSLLWRVSAQSPPGRKAEPQRLAIPGENNTRPAISRDGHRLAFGRGFSRSSIWLGAAPNDGTSRGTRHPATITDAKLLLASTRSDDSPQFSPDGKRIAFASTRSGSFEIWTCEADGSNPVQLTFLNGAGIPTTPRWSPDGTRISFDSDAAGNFDVWVVNANGGKPQRMTTDPTNDGDPSWAHDGHWIYFDSGRTGRVQMFKIPSSGGEAIQLSQDGGVAPLESSDGKFIFFASPDAESKAGGATSLWKMPIHGGQATKIIEHLRSYIDLAIVDSGVYFIPTRSAGSGSSIQFLSFATNQIRTIATFDKPLGAGLAVSPDGKWMLYSQVEAGSELMLVDNFH